MKQRELIGKTVDVKKLRNCADEFSFPEELEEGEDYYNDYGQFTVAEIFLDNCKCDNSFDNAGYNAYSLKVIVEGDKIIKLIRLGHCHFWNGEGTDFKLKRFPFHPLETKASEYMTYCTNLSL